MDKIFQLFSSFKSLPLLEFFGITFFLIFIIFEIGEFIGRKHRKEIADRSPITAIVTATLGLLAFLLAFTYENAGNYFETRRLLVIEEASAIEAAFLRADFLPDPLKSQAKNLLREYVDFRYEVFVPEKRKTFLKKAEEIIHQLWEIAAQVGIKEPSSVPFGMFAQSASDVISMHNKRLNFRTRVNIPEIVWLYLYIVTILSIGSLGYYFGISKLHLTGIAFILVLTFSAVLLLIADLDRPEEGYFRVSQEPLTDLIEKFKQK